MAAQDLSRLLGPDDPAPVLTLNTDRPSPFLLIGDHAGSAIPAALGDLGVSASDFGRHIACDIGVRGLGEALSRRLDATFVHQAYSRLVIDCNRSPQAADAVPEESDGTYVPGNAGLPPRDRTRRVVEIHVPYQAAIADEIARRADAGIATTLVSLHSFTPVMAGQARPWHVGVLYGGGNELFARRMLKQLRRESRLMVGDNAPYRMDETDYSVPAHAFAGGLDYVELEVRQDLIDTPEGQRHWAELIATALLGARS